MKQSLIVGLCGVYLAMLLAPTVMADDCERGGKQRGHHGKMQQRQLVLQYMVEAGDITQAEIDERVEARKVLREELKALREAGDDQGFEEKKAAMKASMREMRAETKAYVESHEDLKSLLEEQRKAKRSKYRGHHDKD